MNEKINITISKLLGNSFGLVVLIMFCLACFGGNDAEENTSTTSRTPRKSEKSPSPLSTNGNSPSPSPSAESNSKNAEPIENKPYREQLPTGFRLPNDSVGQRILSEYGAVYVAKGGATPPPTVMFSNDSECSSWQSQLKISRESIGGFSLELQSSAMNSLKNAIAEAQSQGVTITPRGSDSARRSYGGTVELWASRVNPALTHWVGKGRIKQEDANRIKALSPTAQVPEVLKLEDQGIYFSKDFSKSILQSVAAPGTSQHLSMLALDVSENDNSKVREILAKNNWYQTVVSDLPHFTYLGVTETDLPKLGLKKTSNGGRIFWIPSL